jgi:hypothetical protein
MTTRMRASRQPRYVPHLVSLDIEHRLDRLVLPRTIRTWCHQFWLASLRSEPALPRAGPGNIGPVSNSTMIHVQVVRMIIPASHLFGKHRTLAQKWCPKFFGRYFSCLLGPGPNPRPRTQSNLKYANFSERSYCRLAAVHALSKAVPGDVNPEIPGLSIPSPAS